MVVTIVAGDGRAEASGVLERTYYPNCEVLRNPTKVHVSLQARRVIGAVTLGVHQYCSNHAMHSEIEAGVKIITFRVLLLRGC
jgi:hypothetical protein